MSDFIALLILSDKNSLENANLCNRSQITDKLNKICTYTVKNKKIWQTVFNFMWQNMSLIRKDTAKRSSKSFSLQQNRWVLCLLSITYILSFLTKEISKSLCCIRIFQSIAKFSIVQFYNLCTVMIFCKLDW